MDVSAFAVDVLTVGRLATASAVTELEEAAQLYTGDFLEGLSIESGEFESWRREVSARSKGQVLDVLTRLMTQLAASGESERAIEAGLRILRLEPLHETAARSLMRLYAGSGRRASAVELYRTLSDQLKKDLGAQPEPQTRAVYVEITKGGEGKSASVGDIKSPPSTTVARGTSSAVEPSLPANSSTPVAFQKANRRSIGWLAGAVALAMLLFVTFVPSFGPAPTGVPATVVAATPTSAVSLAVLPFANLSSEQDQEFFSDGLTEEITSALAKVQDLRIVARTSAFEFKGQNRNIRTIGEQLGATHLIEGSVRRAGDRIRITVQLIRADDGTRIWSENYDRELTDIFATQEEIARAITTSLHTPLGLGPGENLVNNRGIDPDSYQRYLRAKALYRARGLANLNNVVALAEQVVASSPDYAPAWALLSSAHTVLPNYSGLPALPSAQLLQVLQSSREKAEPAGQKAIQLDPTLADGYVALGTVHSRAGKYLMADELYSKALALDPNQPEALNMYSQMLSYVGESAKSLALRRQSLQLEPFDPNSNLDLSRLLWLSGDDDGALAILTSLNTGNTNGIIARVHAGAGRFDEAVNT
ncbi:MAG TPA: BTAD domain-containing putative transcriptional regulator, partial [Hyphomicrobiaceae bacterium]